MGTLAESIILHQDLDYETLSPFELRLVIEQGVDFEKLRCLTRLANNQARAAEWLIKHSDEVTDASYDSTQADQDSRAYHDIFIDYCPEIAARKPINYYYD